MRKLPAWRYFFDLGIDGGLGLAEGVAEGGVGFGSVGEVGEKDLGADRVFGVGEQVLEERPGFGAGVLGGGAPRTTLPPFSSMVEKRSAMAASYSSGMRPVRLSSMNMTASWRNQATGGVLPAGQVTSQPSRVKPMRGGMGFFEGFETMTVMGQTEVSSLRPTASPKMKRNCSRW
ncbi:MAG: hypothetical protein QM757_02285 [Paludibaculum sp.]